jgi:hypothetical protein
LSIAFLIASFSTSRSTLVSSTLLSSFEALGSFNSISAASIGTSGS